MDIKVGDIVLFTPGDGKSFKGILAYIQTGEGEGNHLYLVAFYEMLPRSYGYEYVLPNHTNNRYLGHPITGKSMMECDGDRVFMQRWCTIEELEVISHEPKDDISRLFHKRSMFERIE